MLLELVALCTCMAGRYDGRGFHGSCCRGSIEGRRACCPCRAPWRVSTASRPWLNDGEGNGPDAMVYALTESGELLTECTDADTAVHLIVARDPEDGRYYPVDSRTITDDIDVTVERGPDDVPAQVPIVKEQRLRRLPRPHARTPS